MPSRRITFYNKYFDNIDPLKLILFKISWYTIHILTRNIHFLLLCKFPRNKTSRSIKIYDQFASEEHDKSSLIKESSNSTKNPRNSVKFRKILLKRLASSVSSEWKLNFIIFFVLPAQKKSEDNSRIWIYIIYIFL